jgi:DNA-directed RNA polymerase subunit RPC12/RpoP
MPSDRVRCPRCKLLSLSFRSTFTEREYRCRTCGYEFDDPRRLDREHVAREKKVQDRREALETIERMAADLISDANRRLATAVGAVLRPGGEGAGQAATARFLKACRSADRSALVDLANAASAAQRADGQARWLRSQLKALSADSEITEVPWFITYIVREHAPHPMSLDHIIGQKTAVARLREMMASHQVGEFGPHVVICGPPGSGRAALASAFAHQLAQKRGGSAFLADKATHAGALAACLTKPNAVLIVEVGELHPDVAPRVLEATSKHTISVRTGDGDFESAVHIPVEPFALVAMAHRTDEVPEVLRSADCMTMAPYGDGEIREILTRGLASNRADIPTGLVDEAVGIGQGELSIAAAVLWLALR